MKQLGAAKNFPNDIQDTFYRDSNVLPSGSCLLESSLTAKSVPRFLPVGLGTSASNKVATLNADNAYKTFAGERASSRMHTAEDSQRQQVNHAALLRDTTFSNYRKLSSKFNKYYLKLGNQYGQSDGFL